MLISHKYKAIFVHIQRTGGNSIQKIFAEFDPDVIETIPIDPGKLRTKHCFLGDIKEAVSDEIFSRYTKFCVVRNPFDRMVSWYSHFTDEANAGDAPIRLFPGADAESQELAQRFATIGERVKAAVNHHAASFAEFLALPPDYPGGLLQRLFSNQLDYIMCQGVVAVDSILRFESLAADFAGLATALGFAGQLPHVNNSARKASYQGYYTPQLIAEVRRRFQPDCEYFGYEF